MEPRRRWLLSAPSADCDVVLTLPKNSPIQVLPWLLDRLKMAEESGLESHLKRHISDNNMLAVYIRATDYGLLKAAEEAHLMKPLRQKYGGGRMEFSRAEAHRFEGIPIHDHEDESSDDSPFFSTMERQMLALRLVETIRAYKGDSVAGVQFREGQALIPKCLSAGLIAQLFPLHEPTSLEVLRKTWVEALYSPQPLNDIFNYFGAKVAIYFAWLGHYTVALILPAAIGLIVWISEWISANVGDAMSVLLALVNAAWASAWLEAWKRRSAALSYSWGTLDQRTELLTEPRPLFQGELAESPVTGLLEPTFPSWKRHAIRHCVSFPIIIMCLLFAFATMFTILQLQDWWDYKLDMWGYPYFLSYFPKVLMGLIIAALDSGYNKVAVFLNDLENYRDASLYENHLIIKVAMFQFVNSFISLFYIGFYLHDMDRLREQLAALLITRQLLGNVKESAIPYVLGQLKLDHLLKDASSDDTVATNITNNESEKINEVGEKTEVKEDNGVAEKQPETVVIPKKKLSQVEAETAMLKYEGTFEDHMEMFIQFGYVVLFSSAFPLAALCALLNNFIEIRSDAFKLCNVFQRPFGEQTKSIGTWQDAMEVVGVIAVIVNCALIGMSGHVHRLFPSMTTAHVFLLIVGLEHAILALKAVISYAIPDIPQWVATEMAKSEFARREAFRKALSTDTTLSPLAQSMEVECQTDSLDVRLASTESIGGEAVTSTASPETIIKEPAKVKEETSPRGNERGAFPRSRELLTGMISGAPLTEEEEGPVTNYTAVLMARASHLSIRRDRPYDRNTSGVSASDPDLRSGGNTSDRVAKEPASADVQGAASLANPRFRFPPDRPSSDPQVSPLATSVSPLALSSSPMSTSPFPVASRTSPISAQTPIKQQADIGAAAASSSLSSSSEDSPAKHWQTLKAKRGLLKRACSVSIFALKPREKTEEEKKIKEKEREDKIKRRAAKDDMSWLPKGPPGGELSHIPLEKLIQLDDIKSANRRRTNP